MKDPQYYSKIALDYCRKHYLIMVTCGNLQTMEDLLDLFGADREMLKNKSTDKNGCLHMREYMHRKIQYVLNRLDRESQKPNAIFEKKYITYNGIINRPTRCFKIREGQNQCDQNH